MKRLATFTTILVAAIALAGVAPGTAQAQDNAAVAINLRDGASIFRFAFKISRVNQDVVDNSNAAAAVSSCTECQTIAAAFQVVLIFSDPDVVTPENLALALNIECTACETLASAYQWVLTTGGPVHFTAEGNRRIAEIRRALLQLLQSAEGMTLAEIQAAIDALADELEAVIASELAAAGPPEVPEEPAEADGSGDPPSTEEPTDTTSTETTPTETTTEPTETTETTTTTP